MQRLNCWEFKGCGRQPGGERSAELGVCPAAVDALTDGVNGGVNGGRICWAVSGHFTDEGTIRCSKAHEIVTCMACEFFKTVLREEGIDHIQFVRPRTSSSVGPGQRAGAACELPRSG